MFERRTLEGGVRVLVPKRLESAGFLVAFTERTGGLSTGPHAELNLGLGTADDPKNVAENRLRACRALGIGEFALAQQVHGARQVRVGPRHRGAGFIDASTAVSNADALVTATRNLPMAVLTADCVPIALVDPEKGSVALVHAGWRGVAAGIVAAALDAFAEPGRLLAAVGPAIGPDHYEVGPDVALAVSAATEGGAVLLGGRTANQRLDLPGTVVRILKERGVRPGHIEPAGICTACEPERFFSYRRDGETGRQALIAARMP
jgi:YfiH family protein